MNFINQEKRPHKEQLYQLFSQISQAMANPHRLELLDLLAQAPRTVEELSHESQMSLANTSQHLQKLKQARLVSDKREGQTIRYRLADIAVADMWLQLRRLAEKQFAEVERSLTNYRPQRQQIGAISAGRLHQHREQFVVVDVRRPVEYQTSHLPGAISIPLDQLEQRFQEIPAGKAIVVYCRGPYCTYADEALIFLTQQGRQVYRLEEGVLEWQRAGYSLN